MAAWESGLSTWRPLQRIYPTLPSFIAQPTPDTYPLTLPAQMKASCVLIRRALIGLTSTESSMRRCWSSFARICQVIPIDSLQLLNCPMVGRTYDPLHFPWFDRRSHGQRQACQRARFHFQSGPAEDPAQTSMTRGHHVLGKERCAVVREEAFGRRKSRADSELRQNPHEVGFWIDAQEFGQQICLRSGRNADDARRSTRAF